MIEAASSWSVAIGATIASIAARATSASAFSARPARRRTISASAQNVIPSPYEGARPWSQAIVSG